MTSLLPSHITRVLISHKYQVVEEHLKTLLRVLKKKLLGTALTDHSFKGEKEACRSIVQKLYHFLIKLLWVNNCRVSSEGSFQAVRSIKGAVDDDGYVNMPVAVFVSVDPNLYVSVDPVVLQPMYPIMSESVDPTML
ncbi:hypothetical protein M9H77_32144 [Catharanthus roseus]|uniref:Uncharacterized protein n=1 Tax=Catharanthus roseus TaxID=4058 RepID=A0ACC0A253_CATRO|nr:hypothetical protein M9H77_32144 [Catharanthus roseus]